MKRSRGWGIGGALLGLFVLLFAVALLFGGCAYSGYTKAIRLDEGVKTQWAQVDTVLQRRYDLVPNLVETVKGYATHEQELFGQIAEARTKYFQAGSPSEKVDAANSLERALSRLLVLQERYPELKAAPLFQDLMTQLEGTENRIRVERGRYNETVNALNTYVRGPLGGLFAGWAGVKPAEYFETPPEAREAPKVDFGAKT